jgi:hypothetical protein
MTSDGFPSAAEIRRLEAEADALLKQDAKDRGFIKDNGRGFSAYARSIGIVTKKTLETTYKHEQAVSLVHKKGDFSMDERLDFLARGMDKIEQTTDDREEDR